MITLYNKLQARQDKSPGFKKRLIVKRQANKRPKFRRRKKLESKSGQ